MIDLSLKKTFAISFLALFLATRNLCTTCRLKGQSLLSSKSESVLVSLLLDPIG